MPFLGLHPRSPLRALRIKSEMPGSYGLAELARDILVNDATRYCSSTAAMTAYPRSLFDALFSSSQIPTATSTWSPELCK